MNKLILVESIDVGKFTFHGYIVGRGDNILSYCIFVNDMDVPLIELLPDLERNVKIAVNKDILNFINNNKTPDRKLRMGYFKQFYNFIIASEKKAFYILDNLTHSTNQYLNKFYEIQFNIFDVSNLS